MKIAAYGVTALMSIASRPLPGEFDGVAELLQDAQGGEHLPHLAPELRRLDAEQLASSLVDVAERELTGRGALEFEDDARQRGGDAP
jgi:hypothetical protein